LELGQFLPAVTTCLSVASSRGGVIIGAGTNAGVLSWDIRRPAGLFRQVNIQPEEVASIRFHPNVETQFLAGDDDGNLLLFDLHAGNDENGVVFYQNDETPVFQCGFSETGSVFSLTRTAGIHVCNTIDSAKDLMCDDMREEVNSAFGYPIDAHFSGGELVVFGGDSDGGVAAVLVGSDRITLKWKLEKANRDCVNATHYDVQSDGSALLSLAGDAGHLSFWRSPPPV
jgi:WD40 repeat protein